MSEGDAVKVCLRVRPIIQREQGEQGTLLWKAEKSTISQIDGTKTFNFDRVFDSDETTSQVYEEVAVPIIRSALQGYNGTIFAYGQTSSGKTYTMMGTPDNLGIIPRAVQEVFQIIQKVPDREFLLRVSYMEIYNETVTDLLCDDGKKKPLEIREDFNRNVYVASLTEEIVRTPEHVLKWIKKGEKNRHYGETKMNDRSSRSHTIFRMIVESRDQNDPANSENCDGAVMVSHLNLVDLAGSERASQTGAEGVRFKEGCNINRSLFILGQVIKKLSDGQAGGFINYRDSKLTRILQNSLGGNTKTVIICTITSVSYDETLSTLQFASTAKHVRNTPHVNEVLDDQALLKRYRKEIMDLKKQLESLEASSEMKAHAMAKEEHSQLLAEIKQLQKDREDRIWNLTNIVVASSQVSHEDIRVNRKRRVTWAPGKIHKSLCAAGVSSFDIESNLSTNFTKLPKLSTCSILQELDESNRTEFDFEDATHIFDDTALDIDLNFGGKVTQRDKAASRSMMEDAPILSSAEFQDSSRQKSMEQKVSDLENKLKNLSKEYEVEVQKRLLLERETTSLKEQVQSQDEKVGLVNTLELQLINLKDELQNRPVSNQHSHETRDSLGTPEKPKPLETDDDQVEDTATNVSGCCAHMDKGQDHSIEEPHLNHDHDVCREQIQMLEQKIVDLEGNAQQNDFMESLQICEALMKEKETALQELEIMRNNFDSLVVENESQKIELADIEKYIAEKQETNEFEMLEKEAQKEHETQLIHEIANLKSVVENAEVYNQELEAELDRKSRLLKNQEQIITELKKDAEDLKKKISYMDLSASLGEGEKLCEEVFQLKHSLSDAETVTRDAQREAAFLRSENLELKKTMEELSVRCEQREKDAAMCERQLEMEKSNYKRMQADLQKELQCAFNEINQLNGLLAGRVPKDLLSRVELEKEIADYAKRFNNTLEEKSILEKEVACLSEYKTLPGEVKNLKEQMQKTSEELLFLTNEKQQSDCIIDDQKHKLQEQSDQMEKLTEEAILVQAKLHQTEQKYSELKLLHEELQERCSLTTEEMAKKDREVESLLKEVDELKRSVDVLECRVSSTLQEKEELVRAKQELAACTTEMEEVYKSTLSERDSLQDQLNNFSSLAATLQQQVDEQSDLYKMKQELEEKNLALITEIEQLREQLNSLKSSQDDMLINNTEASRKLENLQDEMELLVQHRDELYDKVEALKAEKDSLKQDLSENIDLSIETQDELRITQEELKQQKRLIADLRKQITDCAGGVSLQAESQENTVQEKMSILTIQLKENEAKYETISNEKMELERVHQSLISEMEVLQQRVQCAELALTKVEGENNELKEKHRCLVEQLTSVSEEFEELKNLSKNLQEEKDLKDEIDLNAEQACEVSEPVQPLSERHLLLEEDLKLKAAIQESEKLHETLSVITSERDQLKLDLQKNTDMVIALQEELRQTTTEHQQLLQKAEELEQTNNCLRSEVESLKDLMETQTTSESLQNAKHEAEKQLLDLQQQMEVVVQEKNDLNNAQDKLLAELDQLKENLIQNNDLVLQLKSEMQQKVECQPEELAQTKEELEQLMKNLKYTEAEVETLRSEKLDIEQRLFLLHQQMEIVTQELGSLRSTQESLTSERDKLQQNLEKNMEMVLSLQEELLQKATKQQELIARKEELEQGQSSLRCEVESLKKNMMEAQSTVQFLQNERLESKQQLVAVQQHIEVVAQTNEVKTTEEILTADMNDLKKNNEKNKITGDQQRLLQNGDLTRDKTLERDCDLPLNSLDKSELATLQNEKMKTEENLFSLQQHIEAVTQEREELQARLQSVMSERDQLKEDLRENVEMSIETQDDLRSTQDELQQQRQKVEQLADVISSLDKKSSTLEKELHNTTTLLKEATSEQDILNQSKQKVASEMDQLLNDVKCKEYALGEAVSEKLEASKKILKLTEELKIMADERDQMQSSKENLQKEYIETHEELRRNQEELQERNQRIEKLTTEFSILEEKSSSFERELQEKTSLLTEAVGEREVLVQSKQKLSADIERLMEAVKSKDSELGQVAVEKEEASQKILELTKELRSVSQEKDELQLSTENLQKEAENLRGEIQRLQHTHDLFVEHQNQSTGQLDDLVTEIKQLQQKINLGDATTQQLQNEKASLQKQVQQYEMEMGSLLQEQEQRIEKLTNEFSLLEEKSSSLERELQEKITLLTEAVGEREVLVQSKQKLSADLEQLMEEVKSKVSELGQVAVEKEEASQKILELTKELRSVSQDKDELQLSKEILQKEADQLREEIQQLQHQHDLYAQHQNQKSNELDDLVAEIKQLQEKINFNDTSTRQLETDKASLQKQVHQCELDTASLRQEQEQFQQLLQRARNEKENIYANLQDQEKDTAQLRDALNTTQTQLQAIAKERDESNERLLEKVGEINELLQQISSVQQELQELHQEMKDEKRKNRDLCEKVELMEKEITALPSIQNEPVEEEDELAERTEIFKNKNQEFTSLMVKISNVCSNHQSFLKNISSELQSEIEAQKQSMSAIKESLSSPFSREFGNLLTENVKLNAHLQALLTKFKVLYNNTAIKEEHYSIMNDYERDLCAVQKRNDELTASLEQHGMKLSEAASEDLKFCELEFLTQLLMKKVEVLKRVKDGFSKVEVAVNSMEDDLREEANCKQQFLLWLEELRDGQNVAKKLIEGVHQENSRVTGLVKRLTKQLKTVNQNRLKQDTTAYLNRLETDLQEKKEENKALLQRIQNVVPSGDSSILQEENARLHDNLKTVEVHLKRLQCRIKDLENELSSAKADARRKEEKSSQLEAKLRTSTAEAEISEMRLIITEREKHLQTAVKEIQVLQEKVAKGSAPYKDEMDSLKSQLVMVEMNKHKLSKSADQQIASLKACLEDKEECLRKVKEQLRRAQKDADTTICGDGEGASSSQYPLTCGGGSGIVQSTAMLILQSENATLKREISQYRRKCHQLSRNISVSEEEIKKIKEQSEATPTPISVHQAGAMSHSNAEVYKQAAVSPIRSDIPPRHIASPGKTGLHRKTVRSPSKTVMHEPRTMSPNKIERHSVPIMSPGKTGPYRKHAVSPTKTDVPLFSALIVSPRKNLHVPEINSPKDKFFDARSKSMPYNPKKFFDNSMFGTLPDQSTTASVNNPCFEADVDTYARAASETKEINWWDQAAKKENANECKTS